MPRTGKTSKIKIASLKDKQSRKNSASSSSISQDESLGSSFTEAELKEFEAIEKELANEQQSQNLGSEKKRSNSLKEPSSKRLKEGIAKVEKPSISNEDIIRLNDKIDELASEKAKLDQNLSDLEKGLKKNLNKIENQQTSLNNAKTSNAKNKIKREQTALQKKQTETQNQIRATQEKLKANAIKISEAETQLNAMLEAIAPIEKAGPERKRAASLKEAARSDLLNEKVDVAKSEFTFAPKGQSRSGSISSNAASDFTFSAPKKGKIKMSLFEQARSSSKGLKEHVQDTERLIKETEQMLKEGEAKDAKYDQLFNSKPKAQQASSKPKAQQSPSVEQQKPKKEMVFLSDKKFQKLESNYKAEIQKQKTLEKNLKELNNKLTKQSKEAIKTGSSLNEKKGIALYEKIEKTEKEIKNAQELLQNSRKSTSLLESQRKLRAEMKSIPREISELEKKIQASIKREPELLQNLQKIDNLIEKGQEKKKNGKGLNQQFSEATATYDFNSKNISENKKELEQKQSRLEELKALKTQTTIESIAKLKKKEKESIVELKKNRQELKLSQLYEEYPNALSSEGVKVMVSESRLQEIREKIKTKEATLPLEVKEANDKKEAEAQIDKNLKDSIDKIDVESIKNNIKEIDPTQDMLDVVNNQQQGQQAAKTSQQQSEAKEAKLESIDSVNPEKKIDKKPAIELFNETKENTRKEIDELKEKLSKTNDEKEKGELKTAIEQKTKQADQAELKFIKDFKTKYADRFKDVNYKVNADGSKESEVSAGKLIRNKKFVKLEIDQEKAKNINSTYSFALYDDKGKKVDDPSIKFIIKVKKGKVTSAVPGEIQAFGKAEDPVKTKINGKIYSTPYKVQDYQKLLGLDQSKNVGKDQELVLDKTKKDLTQNVEQSQGASQEQPTERIHQKRIDSLIQNVSIAGNSNSKAIGARGTQVSISSDKDKSRS